MSKNRDAIEKVLNYYTDIKLTAIEKKKITDSRRQKLIREISFSVDQKQKIDELYMTSYGKKIPHDWHKLYQSFTGSFQPEYFPDLLFSAKAEPKFNSWSYRYVLDDKMLLSVFAEGVEGVKLPELIGGCANGVFFDNKRNVLNKDQFAKSLLEVGECVFKQTKDTDSGNGVQIHNLREETVDFVFDIIDSYKSQPFIVQALVKPHGSLKAIYPDAVNTFRVVTYVWNGNIYHFPVTLRLGRNGNRIDNAHAGGIFVGVDDDGRFMDYAFTEFRDSFSSHPDTGYVFKGSSLPYIRSMISVAEKMHVNGLSLGLISWDITVDEDGTFVLIEANTNGQTVWFPQMASGKPAFGENTFEILKWLKKK